MGFSPGGCFRAPRRFHAASCEPSAAKDSTLAPEGIVGIRLEPGDTAERAVTGELRNRGKIAARYR